MKKKIEFLVAAVLLLCMAACNKDSNLRFSNADVKLYYDQIKYLNTNLKAVKVQVSSNNEQVALAESQSNIDINMILVRGVSIGSAVVKGQWNNTVDSCKVIVEPRCDMFEAPCCFNSWGQPKSTIQSQEKRSLREESENSLTYKGDNNKVSSVVYFFESDALQRVVVQLTAKAVTDVNLKHYLFERYRFVSKDENAYCFENRYDAGSRIILWVSNDYGIQVAYTNDPTIGIDDLFSGSSPIVIDDPEARNEFYGNLEKFCKEVDALIP